MKKVLLTLASILGLGSSAQAQAPFFQDNFDNGKKTGGNGFTWASTGANVVVSTQEKFSGTHALQFRFGPNPVGKDAMAEQRFNMGKYLNEIWIEYMLFIPTNFTHRNDSPANNKFIVVWRDIYSDINGGTQQLAMEYDATAKKGSTAPSSFARPMARAGVVDTATVARLGTLKGFAVADRGPNGKVIPRTVLISPTGPIVPGKWTRIRFHFKLSSERLKADGVYQMWANDVLVVNAQNQAYWNAKLTPTDASFRNGYLLGWANSGFTEQTLLYIDDVKFYDTNPGWK